MVAEICYNRVTGLIPYKVEAGKSSVCVDESELWATSTHPMFSDESRKKWECGCC